MNELVPQSPFTAPRRVRYGLGAIVILALALRAWLFIGYALVDPMDDWMYVVHSGLSEEKRNEAIAQIANDYRTGRRITNDRIVAFRLGVLAPMRWARALVRDPELAAALPSLVASLATIVLVFWIGQMSLGDRGGIWAALLFAVCPLDVMLSTRILASSIHLFWLTGAIAWLVVSGAHPTGSSRARWTGVVAAAFWFLAYLSRRTAIIALPILVVWALTRVGRKPRPAFGVFFGVIGIAWLFEGAFYYFHSGVFALSTLAESQGHLSMFDTQVAKFHFGSWLTVHCVYHFGVPHHFFKLGLGLVEHYDGLKLFALYAPLALASAALAIYQRRHWLFVWWLSAVFVYFQYGFIGLERDPGTFHWNYFLVFPRLRYLALLIPPLCLLGANLLLALERIRPLLGTVVFAAVAITSIYHGHKNHQFYRGSLSDLRAAAAFIEEQIEIPDSKTSQTVYADPWAVPRLDFFATKERTEFVRLQQASRPQPGDLVVVGGSRGYELEVSEIVLGLGPVYEAFFFDTDRGAEPPTGWSELFRHRGPRLPQRQSDLVVYRIDATTP